MRRIGVPLLAFMLCAVVAHAQDPAATAAEPATTAPTADPAAPVPDGAAPAAPPVVEEPPSGDIIHLKSGAKLTGMQVLRRNPTYIFVEIAPGTELPVPRSQVVNIEYDDIDPVKERRMRERMAKEGQLPVVLAQKVSIDLQKKLTADIAAEQFKFENQDLLVIIEELRKRTGVAIEVSRAVHDMKPEERVWTVEAAPGTTLFNFLQNSLLTQFATLKLDFPYDRIVIRKQDEPETPQPTISPAAGATPPAAAPAAGVPPPPPPGATPPVPVNAPPALPPVGS